MLNALFLQLFLAQNVVFAFTTIITCPRCRQQSPSGQWSSPRPVIEYNDLLPQPHPDLSAVDVVNICMSKLSEDSTEGLETCFAFSSDQCRAAIGGSITEFIKYAENPPFKYLVACKGRGENSWQICKIGPVISGTRNRGSLQTVLMTVEGELSSPASDSSVSPTGRTQEVSPAVSASQDSQKIGNHQFLWTLQQERRPPLQGCWFIHEILYTKHSFSLTL